MSRTSIEWTHEPGRVGAAWNPIRGCSPVSPGCLNCYAADMAARFSDPGFWGHGFAERNGKPGAGKWTGKTSLIPEKLAEPLTWRKPAPTGWAPGCRVPGGGWICRSCEQKRADSEASCPCGGRRPIYPRRAFVNSMSDLFHEKLSFEEIAAVVGVMAACPEHIFMTLTKRAQRMREWFEWVDVQRERSLVPRASLMSDYAIGVLGRNITSGSPWPLPSWHVGVSAEDQQRWDERVPELLRCPAAVRFVSAEPLLEEIQVERMLSVWATEVKRGPAGETRATELAQIDQVIVGGESGPGARPCRVEWIESIVEQCAEAGVACFVKQMGANLVGPMAQEGTIAGAGRLGNGTTRAALKDKKGGDPSEWPAGNWPREFPA